MENIVVENVIALGLTLSLALLVAFKAGKIRGLTSETCHDRIRGLAVDTLKAKIEENLQGCFNHYCNTPPGVNWKPEGFTMRQMAEHLHNNTGDVQVLQGVYTDLITHSVNSPYFLQALASVTGMG